MVARLHNTAAYAERIVLAVLNLNRRRNIAGRGLPRAATSLLVCGGRRCCLALLQLRFFHLHVRGLQGHVSEKDDCEYMAGAAAKAGREQRNSEDTSRMGSKTQAAEQIKGVKAVTCPQEIRQAAE